MAQELFTCLILLRQQAVQGMQQDAETLRPAVSDLVQPACARLLALLRCSLVGHSRGGRARPPQALSSGCPGGGWRCLHPTACHGLSVAEGALHMLGVLAWSPVRPVLLLAYVAYVRMVAHDK